MTIKSLFHNTIKKNIGLVILLVIFLIIFIVSIKPNFYLIGWDNYSSYFNLPTTIWRTLFHTWRDFRGLGVPSDSEVVDIFRQLYFFVASIVMPEQVLDQTYYLLCLGLGLIGMYFFTKRITHSWFHQTYIQEIVAVISSVVYLCNLNTLAIFYFPIVTYITRFAAIPLLFWVFHYLIYERNIPLKYIFFIVGILLFTTGSYITGTVFITTVISLGIWSVFQQHPKRLIVVLLCFGLLNAFWIFPFVNYTKEKSSLIPLAPTFIDANESQLNKPARFYDPWKQFVLYPNFFDTQLTRLEPEKFIPFHPLATEVQSFPFKVLVSIFPLFAVMGAFIILIHGKSHKKELWIPVLLLLYFFLSLKEYSPLGFVYHWLDQNIPYFGVLFRFGDTKFHPYSAFAGSLSVAIGIGMLIHWLQSKKHLPRKLYITVVGLFLTIGAFPYTSYLTGNLVGSFMYVQLPNEYKEVAQIVNADSESGRFLHLPFDRNAYWKSYSWGALGSSFLHYMIDRPFVDKTFEPASMENAYLHKRLYSVIADAQQMSNTGVWQDRVNEFIQILQQNHIKYVLLDESINSRIVSRGISFGGVYPYQDAKALLTAALEKKQATVVLQRPIKLADYMSVYKDRYPLSSKEEEEILQATNEITLYEIRQTSKENRFLSSINAIDPYYSNILEQEPLQVEGTSYQSGIGTVYPFRRDDHLTTTTPTEAQLSLTMIPGTYTVKSDTTVSKKELVKVVATPELSGLRIDVYWHQLPTINGISNNPQIASVYFPDINKVSSVSASNHTSVLSSTPDNVNNTYRLQVGTGMFPLVAGFGSELTVGTTLIDTTQPLSIRLWEESTPIELNPTEFATTDNPNCFGDATEEYKVHLERYTGGVTLSTKNGSSCMWRSIDGYIDDPLLYMDLVYSIQLQEKTEDKQKVFLPLTTKPVLRDVIQSLTPPNSVKLCISQEQGGDCFNRHVFIQGTNVQDQIRVSMEEPVANGSGLITLVGLRPIGYQEQQITLSALTVLPFKVIAEESIDLVFPEDNEQLVTIPDDKTVTLTIPQSTSRFSYQANLPEEQFFQSNKPCEGSGIRLTRLFDKRLISYVENCYNSFFAELPFASDTFYLWNVGYHLFSGKYPQLTIRDKITTRFTSYASLYQGYPLIPEFKNFQNPESRNTSSVQIQNQLNDSPTVNASVFIPAEKGYMDFRRKEFTITQHAENEGVLGIDSFAVIPMPARWRDLKLIPIQTQESTFVEPVVSRITKILPSLWKITFYTSEQGPWIFRFDQAFDRQWKMFSSKVNLISHGRCDGYANCFMLENKHKTAGETKEYTMYIFYTPEILSFLGWTVTVAGVVFFMRRPLIRSIKGMTFLIRR